MTRPLGSCGQCPPGRAPAQLAQDFRFSGFLWLLSAPSAVVPSALARAAVREARLVAEPEKALLLRGSGVP